MPLVWWIITGLFFLLVSAAVAGWSFAPWVPIWKKDLPRLFALAKLQPGERFYDLGCGDGRTVFYAADHYYVQACGIELALPLWLVCSGKRLFFKRRDLISFRLGSLFTTPLHDADVVYVFGMPEKLERKLRAKLERELKPGCRVLSYTFPIAGWQAIIKDKPNSKDISIYLYQR